jgi:hypothetical protein
VDVEITRFRNTICSHNSQLCWFVPFIPPPDHFKHRFSRNAYTTLEARRSRLSCLSIDEISVNTNMTRHCGKEQITSRTIGA